MTTLSLTDAEADTILSALRLYEYALLYGLTPPPPASQLRDIFAIACKRSATPLHPADIDDLCDRINHKEPQ
jgi:hypothetical protein